MRGAALVFGVLATACSAPAAALESACRVDDGRVYKPGDDFPLGDGCNACHCFAPDEWEPPGSWGCTVVSCPSGSAPRACEPVRGSACPLGPSCGDTCCGQGERCVEGVCMCGDGLACTDGDVCGSRDVLDGDGCGVTCCAAGLPCD